MKLKKYLALNGMKKNFFAKKVGITPVTLNNILNEEYLPNLKTAIAIEDYTKKEVSIRDWLPEIMVKDNK
jgi:DNA-binding XRE family transcriptional regulator